MSNWYIKIAFDYNTSPNMGVKNMGINNEPNITPTDDEIEALFTKKKKKKKKKKSRKLSKV